MVHLRPTDEISFSVIYRDLPAPPTTVDGPRYSCLIRAMAYLAQCEHPVSLYAAYEETQCEWIAESWANDGDRLYNIVWRSLND